ncbi:unnamed protein product [Rotaria magnacalcarata]|uniref:MULE transposase domain-containing protein n=1 Tax=Rotaria magnacalcarata TaxID=392030 RepID=A0A815ZE91_9BILA|nr:unnamed protein product [Rotaria magnacalcarata]
MFINNVRVLGGIGNIIMFGNVTSNVYQVSRISNFLTPDDDDDRLLDLIQSPLENYQYVLEDSSAESELNTRFDEELYQVVDKKNITFGSTNRGGRELYMCGYCYHVKENNAITTRWRCIVRAPACSVTIHTNNIDDSFVHWNGAYHHHPPDRNLEIIKNIISKIKARVLVEPYPVVSMAEEEIRNGKLNKVQLAAMPLPSQMESALQKHRRKNIPPLPLSLKFDIPLLYQRTWSGEEFIIADIRKKKVGGRLIMFCSNEQIDTLLNSTIWFCDGTFKTTPAMFEQVYIIQCLVGDEVFPAVYALTANRKRKTYEEMIKVIMNLAADRNKILAVQKIVSDYEAAWLMAVENMLPNVTRLGCFFHFSQACYRNIQKLGLSQLYDDDPEVRLILRKFIALALVPRDKVKSCFKLLRRNADDRVQEFVQYFEHQWFNVMSSDLWCVADSAIRTNNSSEAYNRRFNSRMLNKHPNIWRFIYILKNEEFHVIQKQLHQLVGNAGGYAYTRRKRARQAIKKTSQIIKLHRLFMEDKKTLEELVFGLSFLVGEPVSKKKFKFMTQSRFHFSNLHDFDGLIQECLNKIPQYSQVYPAPKSDVSASLEEMIEKGFPPNKSIVRHKRTHSQKKYYWIMKPDGNDEVRVKIGNSGVSTKADRDLRILTSTNECKKVVRQFLIRWDKNGVLPGWKTIWTIFNLANYDISERRIKSIYRIIKDRVSREEFICNDTTCSDIEFTASPLSCEYSSNHDNHDNGCVLVGGPSVNSTDLLPPLLPVENVHKDGTEIIVASSITPNTDHPPSECEHTEIFGVVNSKDSDKEGFINQLADIEQVQQPSTNISTTSDLSTSPLFCSDKSPPKSSTTVTENAKKRQRRVYEPRTTPYPTRHRTVEINKIVK